jgi:hypothetical protein
VELSEQLFMSFADKLVHVRAQLAAAARAAGRAPDSVTLLAVSKTMPAERIREAIAAGHDLFGENYAQELRDKAREVKDARWHYIGPLQRNKVKYVVGVAELIHTVDSLPLLDEIAVRADKLGLVQRCLVHVPSRMCRRWCRRSRRGRRCDAKGSCASRPRTCRRDRSLTTWRSWRKPRGWARCRWA